MDNNLIMPNLINELMEKCSKYIDINETMEESLKYINLDNELDETHLPFVFMERLALYLHGEYLTEDCDVETFNEKINENNKIKTLNEINEVFDKYLDSNKNDIRDLFLFAFIDNLTNDDLNTLKSIGTNNVKNVITYYSIYKIIVYDCDSTKSLFEDNFDPIEEIIKIRKSKTKLRNFLLDLRKKGLIFNKKNLNEIIEKIQLIE